MNWELGVGIIIGLVLVGVGAYLWGYIEERLDQRRQARIIDAETAAARNLALALAAAEEAQYVGLEGVEQGALRQFPLDRFMRPPLHEQVVMVGARGECEFVTTLLGLNPNRVVTAQYPWQVLFDCDDVRVIILSSAYELPQIGAITENLHQLSDARFVRLVI